MSEFYDLYKTYSRHELFAVLLNHNDYQPEAIEAAKLVVIENNWTDDFMKALQSQTETQAKEQLKKEAVGKEEAAYYDKAVRIRSQQNMYIIGMGDTARFEDELNNAGIEFFKDEASPMSRGSYPRSIAYYVNESDVTKVDEIFTKKGFVKRVDDFLKFQKQFFWLILFLGLVIFLIEYLNQKK
jgi:hypothetical protein